MLRADLSGCCCVQKCPKWGFLIYLYFRATCITQFPICGGDLCDDEAGGETCVNVRCEFAPPAVPTANPTASPTASLMATPAPTAANPTANPAASSTNTPTPAPTTPTTQSPTALGPTAASPTPRIRVLFDGATSSPCHFSSWASTDGEWVQPPSCSDPDIPPTPRFCDLVADFCGADPPGHRDCAGPRVGVDIAERCGWVDTAAGFPETTAACACGTCEAVDYDICDCLTAATPGHVLLTPALCNGFRDATGNRVCGFLQSRVGNNRCVGCNLFTTALQCWGSDLDQDPTSQGSCEWVTPELQTDVGAGGVCQAKNIAVPPERPSHDAAGNSCPPPPPLNTEPPCRCTDRTFIPNEELREVPEIFRLFARVNFDRAECSSWGSASCPMGTAASTF